MLVTVVPAGGEDQFFSIKRKHGKSIKSVVVGDAFQMFAVEVAHVEVKIEATGTGKV